MKILVMKPGQKDLLLKDLCARLPYRVKVQRYSYDDDVETIETLYEIDSDGCMSTLECDTLKYIAKPYLFPLSNMTAEQYDEMSDIIHTICHSGYAHHFAHKLTDWYNKNHFDYRGLIPMGLAIDVTGLNIY